MPELPNEPHFLGLSKRGPLDAYVAFLTPPEDRTIIYHNKDYGPKTTHDIHVPWLYWLAYVAFSREINISITLYISSVRAVKSTDNLGSQQPYTIKLPNVRPDGSVCMGYASFERLPMQVSVQRLVNEYLTTFWGSEFNSDLNYCYYRGMLTNSTIISKATENLDFGKLTVAKDLARVGINDIKPELLMQEKFALENSLFPELEV